MKYIKYTYRIKPGSSFRFNEEGDLLKEVNVITINKKKAIDILDKNYPHFNKKEIQLINILEMKGLFQ